MANQEPAVRPTENPNENPTENTIENPTANIKTIKDRDLVNKIYEIAKALDDYIVFCYGSNNYPLLQPAQTYWASHTTETKEIGHTVLAMLIKSFSWQRGRSEQVINELREFDEMLEQSESDLSLQILRHLGYSYHGFNSENKAEVTGLKNYFAETLPAAIYWWLNQASKASIMQELALRESDDL